MLVIGTEIHRLLVEQSKPGRGLIWVCTVCLGLLGKQLVFEIYRTFTVLSLFSNDDRDI